MWWKIFFCSFFILLTQPNLTFSNELTVKQFLGYRQGDVYVYSFYGEATMEVIVLSRDKDRIEIEEQVWIPGLDFPDDIQQPISNKYFLIATSGQLIEQGSEGKGGNILLQEPFIKGKTKWEVTGLNVANGGNEKFQSKCTIQDISKKNIFDKERFILSVQCKADLKSGWRKHKKHRWITNITYAEGIGMIEQTDQIITKGSENFDPPKIMLIDIRRQDDE